MTAPPLPHDRHAIKRPTVLPYLLLSLCSLIWAGNWVVGRAIRDTVPPAALAFWRWSIAALILAPIVLPRLKGQGRVLTRHWKVLVLLGGTGISLFQFLVYTGLRYTNAVNAMLMNSALPLFMVLVAWLIDRQKVTARQVAGMVVSFCGIYSVMLRRRPRELDGISFVFVASVIGTAFLAPAYALESVLLQPAQLTWSAGGAVLYVSLFASIAAYLCWNRGVDMVGPNRAGFTQHLIPAFGTALAVIFLGEEVHLFHAVGIATILVGVWLASARGR